MKILSTLLLLCIFLSAARATPLDDKIKALEDAMKASPDSNPIGMRVLETGTLKASGRPGFDLNLESSIHQIMVGNSSPDVQKACQAVLAEMEAERKARIDEFKNKLDAMLAGAPATIAKAQKAADLDSLLQDLQVSAPSDMRDPEVQEEINRANQDYQIVALWQDFLSHRASGNYQQAADSLRNLLNNRPPPGPVLIPRSEILDHIDAMQAQIKPGFPNSSDVDYAAALARIKTLDDLVPEAEKLAAAGPFGMNTRIEPLCRMATMYAQARNGLPFALDFNSGNNYPANSEPDFVHVQTLFIDYALPKLLGDSAPARNAGESVNDYLTRVAKQAEAAQNWDLLQRAITAKSQMTGTGVPEGAQRFLAGLSQERAGQFTVAVTSYQNALNSPNAVVLPEMIGDRLTAIQKDHPNEYKEGLTGFAHPSPFYPWSSLPPGWGVTDMKNLHAPIQNSPDAPPGTKPSPPATNIVTEPAPPTNPSSSGK